MSGVAARDEAVLASAADWFSRYRGGDMDAAADRDLSAWLAEDPAHLAAYRAVERAWAFAGAVADAPATLALREEDARAFRCGVWRAPLRAAAAVAGIASLTLLGFAWRERAAPVATAASTYHNAVGDRTRLRLSDGSIVTLDTDSEVRVLAMAQRRSVLLVRGRAFFNVAHDPSRPFLVSAGGKTVRAIGTAFSVRLDPDRDDIKVALVEGKVEVQEPSHLLRSGRSVELGAGAMLDADGGRWQVGRFDRVDETGWLEGRLVFSNRAIGDAITEMNRYSTRKLVLDDGDASRRTILGVFRAGDVDALARAIVLSGAAHVVSSDDREIVLSQTES